MLEEAIAHAREAKVPEHSPTLQAGLEALEAIEKARGDRLRSIAVAWQCALSYKTV